MQSLLACIGKQSLPLSIYNKQIRLPVHALFANRLGPYCTAPIGALYLWSTMFANALQRVTIKYIMDTNKAS